MVPGSDWYQWKKLKLVCKYFMRKRIRIWETKQGDPDSIEKIILSNR
jgi:hypothetical protein